MRRLLGLGAVVVALTAQAQSAEELDRRERCAVRLSVAITGKAPGLDLLTSIDPQAQADALLDTVDFVERFARFTNASFNRNPGMSAEDDVAYYLAWEVLSKRQPWKQLFVGQYKVEKNASDAVVVTNDPQGLGYFRSGSWKRRYAGNEPNGVLLSAAYRILQNTIGLKLVPSTNAPDADISASGRQSVGCRGCHFDSIFALDTVASVLGKRVGVGATATFSPPDGTPATVLGGAVVHDDKELVTTLVESEAFRFRACRMGFEFLYNRRENSCEGPVFDRCMKELRNNGTMQAALAAIVKDPSFCQ